MNTGGGIRLLLIDDDPDDRELTLRALRQAIAVNHVQVARDGAEAFDFLLGRAKGGGRSARAEAHMIVLDLKLPKIEGMEVLRRLREEPRTRKIPTLALAASSRQREEFHRHGFGHSTCLVKPLERESLSAALGALGLRSPPLSHQPTHTKP